MNVTIKRQGITTAVVQVETTERDAAITAAAEAVLEAGHKYWSSADVKRVTLLPSGTGYSVSLTATGNRK